VFLLAGPQDFTLSMYAEAVTCVAGSLVAGVLPGYPKCLFAKTNVLKSWQSSLALYWTQILKTLGLKLYTKCLLWESEIE
jgi:hypothetical protein